MSTNTALRTKFEQLTEGARFLDSIEQREARIKEIDDARRDATRGSLPQAEISERLLALLRKRREAFERIRQKGDSPSFANVAEDLVIALSGEKPPTDITFHNDRHLVDTLIWLLWPLLEQSVPVAVGRLAYAPGMPSAERIALKQQLADERAQLVAEHERLVDEATEASGGAVTFHHLTENRTRREAEQSKRDIQARQRQHQEEISRAIEAQREKDAALVTAKE